MSATADLRLASTREVLDRADAARRAAALLERNSERYAHLITSEMKKTIRAARAEIAKCAAMSRYFADNAAAMLADARIDTGSSNAFVRYEPLGTILGVMPWNFPFWQVFRFAIPALLAGNSVIVKHSTLVPACAAALHELMHDAGFGSDFVATALPASSVPQLIENEKVRAVVATAGVEAGSHIGAIAGLHIKKVILELGGSDAFIVMESADLDRAVEAAVRSRLHCNGQACTAAKRFIIERSIAPRFERRLVEAMETVRCGDPFDEKTELGPLATEETVRRLERQVEDSVAIGARIRTGGGRLDGTLYAPTVLTDVPLRAPAAQEETFGPVAAVFRADNIDDAIAIANGTRFGLGASIWTSCEEEAAQAIRDLETGQVYVNAIVSSDPRLPFGGCKDSGFGRELGAAGIRELTNAKTVVVNR